MNNSTGDVKDLIALSCSLRTSFAKEALGQLREVAQSVLPIPMDLEQGWELGALIARDRSRVVVPAAFGGAAVVRSAEGTIDILNPSVGRPIRIAMPLESSDAHVFEVKVESDANAPDPMATIWVSGTVAGTLRIVLRFARLPEFEPWREPLLGFVLSGLARKVRELAVFPDLVAMGTLVGATTYFAGSDIPASILDILDLSLKKVTDEDFLGMPSALAEPALPLPASFDVSQRVDTLDGVPRSGAAGLDVRTPECTSSTRRGYWTAVVHQDLFDHAQIVANTLLQFAGTARYVPDPSSAPRVSAPMIPGAPTPIITPVPRRAMLNIDWLSGLGAASQATTGGLGLFSLLRKAQQPSPSLQPGNGVLDRIARKDLELPDKTGKTMPEREFDAGTLLATMVETWGASPSITTNLIALRGKVKSLSERERIALIDSYVRNVLGKRAIRDLPLNYEVEIPPLGRVQIGQIEGSFAFPVGLGPLNRLDIGAGGRIESTFELPPISLTARAQVVVDPAAIAVSVAGAVIGCALFWSACSLIVVALGTATLAAATDAEFGIRVEGGLVSLSTAWRYSEEQTAVLPHTDVVASSGRVSVMVSNPGNFVGGVLASVVASVGNIFGGWIEEFARGLAYALDAGLQAGGLMLPGSTNLLKGDGTKQLGDRLIAGGSESSPRSQLTIWAECATSPSNASLAAPRTQSFHRRALSKALNDAQMTLRLETNPTPPKLKNAAYFGSAFDQNTLNTLLHEAWAQGAFHFETRDPIRLSQLIAMPWLGSLTHGAGVGRVHVWPAVAPTAVVTSHLMTPQTTELHASSSGQVVQPPIPLIVRFDEMRACMESLKRLPSNDLPGQANMREFAFSASVAAMLVPRWPFGFDLAFLTEPGHLSIEDTRSAELFDPLEPLTMERIDFQMLKKLADWMLPVLRDGLASRAAPESLLSPPAWRRPWPGNAQAILQTVDLGTPGLSLSTQSMHSEIMAVHRAIAMIGVLRTDLLEFVDGSGSPTLNDLLNLRTGSVRLDTITTNQGDTIRGWLLGVPDEHLGPWAWP